MKLRLQAAAALVALIALFSAADAHANLRKQQEGPSSSVGPSASISVDSLVNQLSQSSVRDAIKQAQDSVTQKDVEGISPRPFKAASLRGAPKAAATKRKSKVKPTAVVSSNSNTINIPKKRAADKSDAVKVREYEQDVKRQTEQTAKAAEEEDQKRQEFLAEEEADKQNPKAKMMKTQEGKVKLSLKASAMAREANFKTEAGIKKQHMQLEAELREKKSLEKTKQAVAKVAQDEQEKKKEMRKNMKSYFESLNLKSQQKAMAQLDRMDRQSKKDAEKLEKQLKATGELQAEEDRKFNAKKDEHARKQSLEWEKSDEEYVKAVKRGQDQLAALKAKEDELEAKKQQQQEKLDKAAAEKMAIWEAKNKADMVKEEAEKKEEDHMATVVSKVYTPKYDNIIAQDKDLMTANWKKAYTMTFWLKPTGTTGQFTNIFHKGHDDKQRNPSIWIMPNSARIHIRSGTSTGSETSSSSRSSQSWVNGTNVGCDPADSLLGATWNFVGIVHMNTSMEVFFVDPEAENIKRVCYRKLDAPVKNTGPLYSSAPAGLPFIGEIADVRMYNRDLSKYEVFRIAKQKKYKQET